MSPSPRSGVVHLADARACLPGPAGEHSVSLWQHGTLNVKLSLPVSPNHQTPHAQDEIYVIVRGRGALVHDGKRDSFESGDLFFVAAETEHHFEAFSEDLAVWVVFFGPPGGEVPETTMSAPGDVFTAAETGDLSRVRELVADSPSLVVAKDGEGATALHHAALRGDEELVRFLVEHGADVNARDDRFDATPAGWAIEYLREVGGLLAIEIEDMTLAIRQGDVAWVRRFLTRLPALAGCKDKSGKSLRHLAEESGVPEIARLFRGGM